MLLHLHLGRRRVVQLHAGKLLVQLWSTLLLRWPRVVEVPLRLAEHREDVDIGLSLSPASVLTFRKYLLMRCHWMMMVIAVVVVFRWSCVVVAFLYELLQKRMHANAVLLAVEPEARDCGALVSVQQERRL